MLSAEVVSLYVCVVFSVFSVACCISGRVCRLQRGRNTSVKGTSAGRNLSKYVRTESGVSLDKRFCHKFS